MQPQIFSQFSIPQTHTTQTVSFQQHSSQQQPQQPSTNVLTTTVCHQNVQAEPPIQPSSIAAPFNLEQSSYIAAIPMQPMFAAGAVITPIPNPSDFVHSSVVLSPAQSQLQDHLQRKHEELQKIIMQQQDELRRVSEQLFIARYGIIPSIVQVPFVTTIEQEQTNELSSEGSQCMSTSSHMVHSTYYEPTPPQHVQMVPPQPYQQQLSSSSNHQQQQQQPDSMLSQQTIQLQSYTEIKPIETSDVSEQNFLQPTHQQSNQSQSSSGDYTDMMSSYHMLSPWDEQQQQPQSTQQTSSSQQESAN